jgi:hypothetical protein
MNSIEYYNRQKCSWDENEVQSLKSEYETKEMTISEIADIHHRTPGSISYKLKGMGIITHSTLSRGYNEYRNSELYKNIVEKNTIAEADEQKKKEAKKKCTEIKTNVSSNSEIAELKIEINSIKQDVREMLCIIQKLYQRVPKPQS